MAYDESKDEVVVNLGTFDAGGGDIVCRIMRYNGGAAKLALNRRYTRKSGAERLSSLGRLERCELASVIGVLQRADQEWPS